jgi:hypothetical protein
MPPRLMAALLLGCAGAGGVAAQTAPARLEGTVLSVVNGLPVAGVILSVPAARQFVSSDSTGAFALDGLPAGLVSVRVVLLGHPSRDYTFRIGAGKTKRIRVLVDTVAVELAPIVVRASHLEGRWGMAGFYERRRMGYGSFITRETIERHVFADMWQALGSLGIFHSCGRTDCGPTTITRGRRCLMGVYLNGIQGFGEDIGDIDPADVSGIEVYRNDVFAPWELFATRAFVASNTFLDGTPLVRCGSVVVWTRAWASDLPADW